MDVQSKNSLSTLPPLAENRRSLQRHKSGFKLSEINAQVLERFVENSGGDKVIRSVLVANNGIAGVKFIRSIRMWASKTFGNERILPIVVMASPEDMKANAEHIRLADQFVEVPGGTNNNNYANVPLIVQVAERSCVDAVWPGWGHASEYPELPNALAETASGIAFLGPPSGPMAALGDKVGSCILAQAAGVPTLPWSGSGVSLSYQACGGVIPTDVYEKACIKTPDEALESCRSIGYPIMLKASWGGGGKGIRKVQSDDEVMNAFKQVQGEVPGSPIFAMKLAPLSRHLEVQLLADKHGNVCSIFSRDCSVQRRHQKIIEEGPVTAAAPEVLRKMEDKACELARQVGYVGAATVEYLFLIETQEFFFLELNPRLQVEHPVTEWISGVNIPAAQVMIGMGIPLWRIPDIRSLYGYDVEGSNAIDFVTARAVAPQGHVVAVRITSEDPDDGFKPTSGAIDALNFRSSKEVWGYFSVGSHGAIHEYSDSQFGHLFAHGDTRTQAIKNMVVALRELNIRGEIHTIVDYAVDMIKSEEFVGNSIHTGWLDGRIAAQVRSEPVPWHVAVAAGALRGAMQHSAERRSDYLGYLSKGQIPPSRLSLTSYEESILIDGNKYHLKVTQKGHGSFGLHLNNSTIYVEARTLRDGGILMQLDGRAHVIHWEMEAVGTRLSIDGKTCLLQNEHDPSKLMAVTTGKLIRKLVDDGAHVEANQLYAEVEVMKMVMPLLAPAAGKISFHMVEGYAMAAGDMIGQLELDDPTAVKKATPFHEPWPLATGPPKVVEARVDQRFKATMSQLDDLLKGYDVDVDQVMEQLLMGLAEPSLALLQWREEIFAIKSHIPASLYLELDQVVKEFEGQLGSAVLANGTGEIGAQEGIDEEYYGGLCLPKFPALSLTAIMQEAVQFASSFEKANLTNVLKPLLSLAAAHAGGREVYTHHVVSKLIQQFLDVESLFGSEADKTESEVIDRLRLDFKDDLESVVDIVVSHQGVKRKCALISALLGSIALTNPSAFRTQLRLIAALQGKAYHALAATARQMLEHSLLGELRTVAARALTGLDIFEDGSPREAGATSPRSVAPVTRKATKDEGLYAGLDRAAGPSLEQRMANLVEAPAAMEDALASLLDSPDVTLVMRVLEVYIRRAYHPLISGNVLVTREGIPQGCFLARWKSSEYGNKFEVSRSNILPHAMVVAKSVDQLREAIPTVLATFAETREDNQGAVLHVALTGHENTLESGSGRVSHRHKRSGSFSSDASSGDEATESRAEVLTQIVLANSKQLRGAGVQTISLLCCSGGDSKILSLAMLVPWRCGLRFDSASQTYCKDPLLRHVEPPVFAALELMRFSSIPDGPKHCLSRNRQWHLYVVNERPHPKAPPARRVFLRGLVRRMAATHAAARFARAGGNNEVEVAQACAFAAVEEVEESLADALTELERALYDDEDSRVRGTDWASIFLASLPELPSVTNHYESVVAESLKCAAKALAERRRSMLRHTAVSQVEVRLRAPNDQPAWRLVISNLSGHEASADVYREVNGTYTGNGSMHGKPLNAPYEPLEFLMTKRIAARRQNTTYCYDFPALFEEALGELWVRHGKNLDSSTRLVEATELVLRSDVKAEDVLNGSAMDALCPVARLPGQNNIGMVAWSILLRTPEAPDGRRIVVVANDVTFKAGSFGPCEDALFKGAVEYSLQEKLPCVYLAANSGARIGLAEELKQKFKICWVDENNLSKGFEYLYLDETDYAEVVEKHGPEVARFEEQDVQGSKHFILRDIVGKDDGLGVECLSASGAIAGAYSRAFSEGLTITMVTGRTVGIGAYLARLGRRVIQRLDQPIILTGYAALNKVLGREVYTSHMQLGGHKVMGVNGVSHITVEDDLAGALSILQWISYMPLRVGGIPPVLATEDPVDRSVGYSPQGGAFDARLGIAGSEGSEKIQESFTGLFDQGSWNEAQSGWARTVVTGRARLGGIPVGVVAVETSTVMVTVPADPGMPDSSERVVPQAGQVWFPDSAEKTAQAIEEFGKESLPLFVIANWRGFSGGQRDLLEGVLQAGSHIVDRLREYMQPIFVYVPPGGELRGGAWVVVDAQINNRMIEMYADPSARGGVLEPEGIVEIKFRENDLIKAMRRLDGQLRELHEAGATATSDDVATSKRRMAMQRESELLPVYRNAAIHFAEMHDTPWRMKQKHVIRDTVPWQSARTFFHWRLRRRMAEESYLHNCTIGSRKDELPRLQARFLASESGSSWENDQSVALWLESLQGTNGTPHATEALTILDRAREYLSACPMQDRGNIALLDAIQNLAASLPRSSNN